MKRRTILKTLPALAAIPAALKLNIVEADSHKAAAKGAAAKSGSKKTEMPDWAGQLGYSDGSVVATAKLQALYLDPGWALRYWAHRRI